MELPGEESSGGSIIEADDQVFEFRPQPTQVLHISSGSSLTRTLGTARR